MSRVYRLRGLFWAILPLTLLWIGYRLTQTDVRAALADFRVDRVQALILVAFNVAATLLFSLRWWLILRAQGFRVPYLATVRYRLAAFALSYFTPGSQFGGEPLQVYALHARHALPASKALASVTLDKLFELAANFSFLAIGAAVIVRSRLHAELSGASLSLAIAGPALLPLAYMVLIAAGRKPLHSLAHRLIARLPCRLSVHAKALHALEIIGEAERQMASVIRLRPGLVLRAAGASLLVWAASLLEYWLALRVLGVSLTPSQTVLALTAARLAFLTPLPGGIGALEASQMLAMRLLGLSPLTGVAISLWIRGRDILLGAAGAACGALLVEPASASSASPVTAPAGD